MPEPVPHATYNPTWDLDGLFPGGSASPAFAAHLERLEADLERVRPQLVQISAPEGPEGLEAWHRVLEALQELRVRQGDALAFTGCLTAQNTKDERARLLDSRVTALQARLEALMTDLDRKLLEVPEFLWRSMLEDSRFKPIAFELERRRRIAAEKLPPEQEILASDLAVDGYRAWEDLYHLTVGRTSIEVQQDGKPVRLSMGQAANRLTSPDRGVRVETFARWEEAWAEAAEVCACALNHISGFRLNLYRHRGWDDVLKEPLFVARLSQATLNAMWQAVEEVKPRLVEYLDRKARLLGVEKPSWHDVGAPLPGQTGEWSYDRAAAFIIEHFGRFSPQLAEFARRAFENRWIEAEDRPNKRTGGFCTSFVGKGQSRIFLTFSGTPDNVSTIAHELGHAYHQQVVNDLPPFAQDYPMTLAETASTFAERIVSDAAVAAAPTSEERVLLLEQKAQDVVAFLMNIHARFLFETAFYEARKKGPLSVEELNTLMLQAQKRAFGDALGEYHPHFWASKLHFYITDTPFYNFPYTFGYLFSTGLYARAKAEGASFAPKYVALLRDTGRMAVEDLAARHLGVDLKAPGFWREAVEEAMADVEAFLEATRGR